MNRSFLLPDVVRRLFFPGRLDREVLFQEVGHNVPSFVGPDLGEAAVVQAQEVGVALGQDVGQRRQPGPHGGVHVEALAVGMHDGPSREQGVVVVERIGDRDVVL